MIKHTALLIALLLAPAVASAATLINRPVFLPCQEVPPCLDWTTTIAPDFQIHQKTLTDEEVRQIFPPILALGRIEGALTLGPVLTQGSPSLNPLIPILAGTILLLAAYSLIPRAHSRRLRLRSLDLNRDLFT